MIIIFHKNNKVVGIEHDGKNIVFQPISIIKTLFEISAEFPKELIIWCHIDFKSNLNISEFQNIFHHRKIMASFNPLQNSFLSEKIGYVEETPFVKINKKVSYPTWQMSSSVGGIYAEVLLALREDIEKNKNFDYFLHSLAKLAMPNGLLCYSDPRLLKVLSDSMQKYKDHNFILFKFVKQHYKTRWVFLLFLNFIGHERKIPFLPFLISLFYSKRIMNNNLLNKIEVHSSKKVFELGNIDVIIPTIGRKLYLYDVLKDLSKQTHLPINVIIVEQNPTENSSSELDYLQNEKWPFIIKQTFTHQAGACNARNLALSQVESEWVFLNDDDNRFGNELLIKALNTMAKYGTNCIITSYLQPKEIKNHLISHQTDIFGSGNSFIKSCLLSNVGFKMGFEFGYGEDADFGMQLRNQGIDVICIPAIEISHLKAPIGGFRTKPILKWSHEITQPKPSPTVMLYRLLHNTNEQLLGYKTILFFKYYKSQAIKNPIKYFNQFQKQWNVSKFWANKLMKENEI